jgi:hypothetical protein
MGSPSPGLGPLDTALTDQVMAIACRANGLDPTGAKLMQREGVADYTLIAQSVVVRISRNPDVARTEVAVARWLESQAYPGARLASRLPQLHVIEGLVVSWWDQLDPSPAHDEPGWVELGTMLRRFHRLPAPPPGTLPLCDPLGEILCLLDDLPDMVDPADVRFLRGFAGQLRDDIANVRFELGSGPILGGAGPANLVRDAAGTVQLTDFSNAAWGAREWDAVSLASGHRYFNQFDHQTYLDTVAAYGWDPLKWPGHGVLESINAVRQTIRYMYRSDAPADIAALIDDLRQDAAR